MGGNFNVRSLVQDASEADRVDGNGGIYERRREGDKASELEDGMENGPTWTPDWCSQRQALEFSVAGIISVSVA